MPAKNRDSNTVGSDRVKKSVSLKSHFIINTIIQNGSVGFFMKESENDLTFFKDHR